jgi:hypothetical protein
MSDYDFTYLSLGAGVQSTAMYIMSCLGLRDCPRADVAIFADTQAEPQYVYDNLQRIIEWPKGDIPIEVVTNGDLSRAHVATNRTMVPFFVRKPNGERGILPHRKCTADYKVKPIHAYVRKDLGYQPGQVMKSRVSTLLGIGMEEVRRLRESRERWRTNIYPLTHARMYRRDCQELSLEYGFPPIGKSSCYFCPYHSDSYWVLLRDNHPKEFQKAVEYDRSIRHMGKNGVKFPCYIHSSLTPLNEVRFKHDGQGDLFGNECLGMCGT